MNNNLQKFIILNDNKQDTITINNIQHLKRKKNSHEIYIFFMITTWAFITFLFFFELVEKYFQFNYFLNYELFTM
jgi:hypothetical protein